jgi:hypothetical protein
MIFPSLPSATTQRFTQVLGFDGDVAFFSGGMSAMILEVASTNFSLLSSSEQDARIAAYASFLNSLSFPIQILISNRQTDISSYVSLLEHEVQRALTPQVKAYLSEYRAFVQQLVKQNVVLDKRFFLAVSHASLSPATKTLDQTATDSIRAALHTKTDSLLSQLSRMNLSARIIEGEELIRVFEDFYHSANTQP